MTVKEVGSYDEDSGDEAEADMNHLPGRMLRSKIEMKLSSVRSPAGEDLTENNVQKDVSQTRKSSEKKPLKVSSMSSKKKKKSCTNNKNIIKWSSDLQAYLPNNGRGDTKETISVIENVTIASTEYEIFYSDSVVDLIVEMSNLYALPRRHTLNVTVNEVVCILPFCYLLDLGHLNTYILMFWGIKWDIHNEGVSNTQLPYQEYGLGTAVILLMKSCLPVELAPYNFYNLFTNLTLVNIVDTQGNGATGGIRDNRLAKCPVTEAKLLKAGTRGAFSFKTDTNLTNPSKLSIVRSMYNRHLDGVDRFDENLNSPKVKLRGKKWWFPLFAFGLDATCHNAITKAI
ncbi:hypothetical protein ILUMI_16653 [Ignelater luminosus]|uniref:PiggyBac transposable element-derived protein domain-containing protein n=1 Tax=Ignelater luminosus TaxID=2038154 RepID=A0A8K0CLI2_IGNLU|nr:hypothetical protein ILUMI_16653 [Ignelater luminosus]